MKTIVRKPFSDLLFDDLFVQDKFNRTIPSQVKTNILKDEHNYTIQLAAPGIAKENVQIEIKKDTLYVSQKEQEEIETNGDQKYLRKEFEAMSLNKTFKLPENIEVDKISAEAKNGILSIHLPLAVPKKEIPTRITVK